MTRQAGFTLMETLVAFTVFSLASVALLDVYSRATETRLRGGAAASLASRASQLVSEAELLAPFQPLTEGTDSDGTRWRIHYIPVDERMVRLEVRMISSSGREANFATLRMRQELGLGALP